MITITPPVPFPSSASVACQGARGAYSQIAADALFIKPEILYMRTFDGVFRAVENGLCRYGVLPLENSNAGSVGEVYDLMKAHRFYIARGVKVFISHMLLAKPETALKDIKEVYTHDQAFRQCGRFFTQNEQIAVNICANTAAAARFVSESARTDIAAVASETAAAAYGLTVLAKDIQNNSRNFTRFICIEKECRRYGALGKISLMLTLDHKPGALYGVMERFAALGLNLTKLESRPIPDTDFEFMFYFDLSADAARPEVLALLADLEKESKYFAYLGNYEEAIA